METMNRFCKVLLSKDMGAQYSCLEASCCMVIIEARFLDSRKHDLIQLCLARGLVTGRESKIKCLHVKVK